jgi:sterol desaturase/sphingolipid hydroxylase (fatty acid hydroxylase superfamily)
VLNTVSTVLVAALGVHALLKFVFFELPYARRRAALDRSYGNKPAATTTSDRAMVAFTIVLIGLMLWRGVEAVSFLGGVWIGATLIQHSPWRPWPELLTLTVVICWSLVLLV